MAKRQAPIVIEELKPVVEALLFAADEPLSAKQLRVLIEGEKKSTKKKKAAQVAVEEPVAVEAASDVAPQESPAGETLGTSGELEATDGEEDKGGLDAKAIRAIVDALNEDYSNSMRSFLIIEIAGGFQFATRKEYGLYVGRLAKDKSRRRLSQAALETLAIVAYRQPISKPDIEAIRGVNCDEVLSSLMERSLITITGRADTVGRPLLYGTTDDFLRYFGLVSLKDLPRPREIDEMMEARALTADQMMLELSGEDNVAQIEDQIARIQSPDMPPSLAEAAAAMGILEETAEVSGTGETLTEEDAIAVETFVAGSPEGEIDAPLPSEASSTVPAEQEDEDDEDEEDEEEFDEGDLVEDEEEEDEDSEEDDEAQG